MGTDSRPVRAAVVAVVAAAALVPVWASPVLVTTDGPSHLYNALVADAVLSERAPYAPYLEFDRDWTRPDRAAQFLLITLGRAVGFETGERVVFTLAVVGTLAGLLALLGRSHSGKEGAPLVALAPAAAWLAQTWFVWMGFYDFALSLGLYAALLLLLEQEPTPRRRLLVQAVFAGLYLTHFLAFAVGVGLALAVPAWRALSRRGRWQEVAVAAPAFAVLFLELGSGGTGTGALRPADAWLGGRGLVIGDFVVSVHALDVVAGVLIMAAVWFALARRLRAAQREGLASVSGADIFGLLLLVVSVAGPEQMGEGGFVAIRLRCLGVITLLPAIAEALGALSRRTLAAAAGVLLVTLVAHGALIVRDARIVNRNLAQLESLFSTARVPEGAWLRTRFMVYRRGLYSIGGYYHIADRLALRHGYIVLDNYEALYRIFSVGWRTRPDWVAFRQSREGLTVRLVPGNLRWHNALYVLHESDHPLQPADPRIEIDPTLTAGQFALTPVRRRP